MAIFIAARRTPLIGARGSASAQRAPGELRGAGGAAAAQLLAQRADGGQLASGRARSTRRRAGRSSGRRRRTPRAARGCRTTSTGVPACIASSTGQPEALVQGGEDERGGVAVQVGEVGAPCAARRATERQRRRRRARRAARSRAEVLARLVVADVEEVPRLAAVGRRRLARARSGATARGRRPSSSRGVGGGRLRSARRRRRRGGAAKRCAWRRVDAEARVEAVGHALEGEVVDGDDLRRARRRQGRAAGGAGRRRGARAGEPALPARLGERG